MQWHYPHYLGVQTEILESIMRYWSAEEFSSTLGEYVPGKLNFSLFIHAPDHPADVLLSHGLADKNYFLKRSESGERFIDRVEDLLLPGEWMKRRLLAVKDWPMNPDRMHVVGWPRLDALFAAQRAMPPREPGSKPRVLWAPTHDYARRGDDAVSLSSYPELQEFVPLFEEHFDLSVSLHPRNRDDKQPTQHSLLECDYVISDFGTMVYEAWALGKPVIFPTWLIGDRIKRHLKRTAEAHIFEERLGLHAESTQQIVDFVRDGAGIDERTSAFMADYLAPEYAGRSGERTATLVRELAASR